MCLTLVSFSSQKAKQQEKHPMLRKKQTLPYTAMCLFSVTCSPRWGWQVRWIQSEPQVSGCQPGSPLPQNSSITCLLHNPKATVHSLKNKTKHKVTSLKSRKTCIFMFFIFELFFSISININFGDKNEQRKPNLWHPGESLWIYNTWNLFERMNVE